jgi:hypothetical protein
MIDSSPWLKPGLEQRHAHAGLHHERSAHVTSTSSTRPITSSAVIAARCLDALAAIGHALAAFIRDAFGPDRHAALDDATLRDLGISRSELASFRAEAEGRAPVTRRRVARRAATDD